MEGVNSKLCHIIFLGTKSNIECILDSTFELYYFNYSLIIQSFIALYLLDTMEIYMVCFRSVRKSMEIPYSGHMSFNPISISRKSCFTISERRVSNWYIFGGLGKRNREETHVDQDHILIF